MAQFVSALWLALRNFYKKDAMNRGAAISFYSLFSLIPLILLVTAAIGYVLGSDTAVLERAIAFLRDLVPNISERIIADLKGLSVKWRTLSWIAIITLLLGVDEVLNSLALALTEIFDTTVIFKFFVKKIVNMLVLIVAFIAALFSVFVTATVELFKHYKFKIFGIDLYYYLVQSFFLKFLLPIVVVVVAVAFVYRIFGARNLSLRHAFFGSFLFTVLWEVAKQLFTYYIANFPSYNRFYASIGTVMLIMIWIFYTVCIFLFSAAFARAAFEKKL